MSTSDNSDIDDFQDDFTLKRRQSSPAISNSYLLIQSKQPSQVINPLKTLQEQESQKEEDDFNSGLLTSSSEINLNLNTEHPKLSRRNSTPLLQGHKSIKQEKSAGGRRTSAPHNYKRQSIANH
eukprot:Pgem_evm1s2714